MKKQQMKVVAQAEHEMFCLRDLLEGSVPAKVMNRAYEYAVSYTHLDVSKRQTEQSAAGGRAEQPSGADRPSGARAGGADAGASGTCLLYTSRCV